MMQVPGHINLNNILEEYQKLKWDSNKVIIVLDDDPTGIQSVWGITVYYKWNEAILFEIFNKGGLAFIQTNSRSLSEKETKTIHENIAKLIDSTSKKLSKRYTIISRSDSSLRGHYPLEPFSINSLLVSKGEREYDALLLIPFFGEGGRITYKDTHFIKNDGQLTPMGDTEFAMDLVFGYSSSNLKQYVEEKSQGLVKAGQVESISLEMLREKSVDFLQDVLFRLNDFRQVVVNVVDYNDLKKLIIALHHAESLGKRFIYRTAASFVKTYALIKDQDFIDCERFWDIGEQSENPPLFVVGSYTKLTTLQLQKLVEFSSNIVAIEFDVLSYLDGPTDQKELISRLQRRIDEILGSGRIPVLHTPRKVLALENFNGLKLSRFISEGLSRIVQGLQKRPRFIVGKGGITSSDLATKAFSTESAQVEGQILPGVTVVTCDKSSKWGNLPYVIFPGNVGKSEDLCRILELTQAKKTA